MCLVQPKGLHCTIIWGSQLKECLVTLLCNDSSFAKYRIEYNRQFTVGQSEQFSRQLNRSLLTNASVGTLQVLLPAKSDPAGHVVCSIAVYSENRVN